jgi:energy-coupling factor transporter ATP-binding protein EcfA2
MQETKIGKKEITVRDFFENAHNGRVPNLTVQQLYTQFMTQAADSSGISYGLFNGVVKKLRFETGDSLVPGPGQSTTARPTSEAQADLVFSDEPEIFEIGSMEFPEFRKFTTGTVFDQIMSDHDTEGGIFAGTANIVIGESGVGKSTVTLDLLAKIKQQDPNAKVLYISSEMTRNDLFFYYRKMPIIETIPTLLIMDYLMGRFDKTLEKAINGDYDVILIDSYQDIIVKIKDVLGWKSTKAEAWLTGLIVEAADKKGKAIFAIQHMTKGGQYVGSTYLKHATQAMMEIKFDESGRRYVEFSKNRRGGSMVGKRMYYSLVNGEVAWDEAAWRQETTIADLAGQESDRRQNLESEFNSLFLSVKRPRTEEQPAQTEAE